MDIIRLGYVVWYSSKCKIFTRKEDTPLILQESGSTPRTGVYGSQLGKVGL